MIKNQMLLFVLGILITTLVQAQEFNSYTYFENDSISLELDIFLPDIETVQNTPLVIYVHGGGFSNGNRDGGH